MALAAYAARRSRRQARAKRRGARSASTSCFPNPTGMSPANALRFWPKSDRLAGLREEIEKLPSNDQVFAEAIGKAPVALGFIAAPQGASIPETKAGLRSWRRRSEAVRALLPGRRSEPERAAGSRRKAPASLNWIPEHDQIIRRMPMLVRVGDTLYPSLRRRHAAARPRRLDLYRQVVRREQREGVRREDRHRESQDRRFRGPDRGQRPDVDQFTPLKPRSAICRPGRCSTARFGATTSTAASS